MERNARGGLASSPSELSVECGPDGPTGDRRRHLLGWAATVGWCAMPLPACATPPSGADDMKAGQTRVTTPRRTLAELLAAEPPAWPGLIERIGAAKNQVDVLPAGPDAGADLHALQVTARSTLGAVVHRTGGLLVDHGWVRLLGSRSERMGRSLVGWNAACGVGLAAGAPPILLVADDVLGGLFAIDGGWIAGKKGEVFYYAPDTLAWEGLGRGYTDFVEFLLNGDLATFYADARWGAWQAEAEALPGDRAINVYPFLWAEGPPVGERSRRAVPLWEVVELYRHFADQGFGQRPFPE